MYKFTNTGSETEILLYSLIEDGFTAGKLIKALQGVQSDTITLRINSDGGEVFDAIAMYNYLKDKAVHVVIDGICASAASIVAMAGKTITMKQGSLMMIHNPMTLAIGESEELRAQADILDKITESIISIYQSRTHMEHDEIMSLMKAETWMDEAEALGYGFVDDIDSTPQQEAPAISDSSDFEAGARAERERLRALDELYTPRRAAAITKAKYFTMQTAEQIAVDLLKAETLLAENRERLSEVNSLPVKHDSDMDAFIDAVNRKKGR